MEIKIKILSDKEFERIGPEINGADVSDALGVANTKTNRVFVRDTGIDELNKFLLTHEIEHLFEDGVSDADPDMPHIRFKKFRQAVGNIAPVVLPLIGGAIGGPAGAAAGGAVGGGLRAGIGGEKRTFSGVPLAAGIGGATGFGASKLTGNFGLGQGPAIQTGVRQGVGTTIQTTGRGAGGLLPNLLQGAQSAFGLETAAKNIGGFLGQFSPFGGTAQAATAASAGGALQTVGQVAPGGPSPISPTAPTTGSVPQPTGPQQGSGPLGKLLGGLNPQTLLGAGSLAAGLFKQFPDVPSLPPSVDTLRTRATAGGGPLQQQAQGVISGNLAQQFDPLSDAEIESSLRVSKKNREDAVEAQRDLFRNLRPTALAALCCLNKSSLCSPIILRCSALFSFLISNGS